MAFPPSATGDEIDESLLRVRWTTNGSEVALFGGAGPHIKEGFSWNVSRFVHGDFSLSVLGAGLRLQGEYRCTVHYNATALHSGTVALSIVGTCVFSCRLPNAPPMLSLLSVLRSPPSSVCPPTVGRVGDREPAGMSRRRFLPSTCVLLLD